MLTYCENDIILNTDRRLSSLSVGAVFYVLNIMKPWILLGKKTILKGMVLNIKVACCWWCKKKMN